MFLALEEAPFVLQGPRPQVPPSAWESYGLMAVVAAGLAALAVWAVRRFLRLNPAKVAPVARLALALRAAETLPAAEGVAAATRALRAYLADVEPRAAATLSTEELTAVLSGRPAFLPALRSLRETLGKADAVKFAGAAPEVAPLLAEIREAVRRIEEARLVFARAAVAAPEPARPLPAPTAPTEPPPLPGPPPLPRRDHA